MILRPVGMNETPELEGISRHAEVYLDGVEQMLVTFVDTDAGYILQHYYVDSKIAMANGDAIERRREGKVRIKDSRTGEYVG